MPKYVELSANVNLDMRELLGAKKAPTVNADPKKEEASDQQNKGR